MRAAPKATSLENAQEIIDNLYAQGAAMAETIEALRAKLRRNGVDMLEFEWPSADGVCVFYSEDVGRCPAESEVFAGGGWLCCLRGGHSGAHLHSLGFAWTDAKRRPVRVKLATEGSAAQPPPEPVVKGG